MELTLDEAIQQAIAAHREGRLQDAERLYRAILEAQPNHPDANHNLGVLAVAVGKPLEALPFFMQALEVNPKVEQFWLSYLDAQIKLERFDDAGQILIDAEQSGVSAEKLVAIKQQLQVGLSKNTNDPAKDPISSEKKKAPSAKAPSQTQINTLLEHYQKGRLEEAEALSTLLTQQFSNHPFGWKVLGGILRQKGKLHESLLPMQKSVELAPQDAEAHCNLGITLKSLGRKTEAEASLNKAILLKYDFAEAHSYLGNILQEVGRLNEAEASHRKAVAIKPDFALAHNNLGNTLQELGKLDEAEATRRQAIALNPNVADTHYNLGNTLKEMEKLDEAEASYKQAIALEPSYASAYYNLGNTLREAEKLDEAEASYRKFLTLKPNYAEAHYSLGNTLSELGRFEEAATSYRQAIALKHDHPEAYNNLGVSLQELGRIDEAISSYVHAIDLRSHYYEAYANLGEALKRATFTQANPHLYPTLIDLLTEGTFTRPSNVARAILSLLKRDRLIEGLLATASTFKSIKEVDHAIKTLAQFPLLHQLMRICPLPDLQFERLFVSIRRELLLNLDSVEVSPELTHFLSTLSLHCFTNEYVYFETNEETELVSMLEAAIAENIAQASQVATTEVLCLATFRPLHQYDWSEQLQIFDQLSDVKTRLIDEPRAERVIAEDIPALTTIDDAVSLKVREQYEENPYPRWVKLRLVQKAKSVAEVCDDVKLQLHAADIKNVLAPSILIAGCGTGQHSIEAASRFANSTVTAIDVSRASLAYSKRKASELGFSNLEYMQADILKLGMLNKRFDIVESSGVLHHMSDPLKGWRVLVDLLNTGGLMKIGLYSELARRHIVKVQQEIASTESDATDSTIRQLRHVLAGSNDEHHQRLSNINDFYTVSMFRDLVLHVQEHRFTLLEINSSLDKLGMKFCGFEGQGIVANFKKNLGEDADACDLLSWHQFEQQHPDSFIGMYQFWCQKA